MPVAAATPHRQGARSPPGPRKGALSQARTRGRCFSVYRSRLKCQMSQWPTEAHSFSGEPRNVLYTNDCVGPQRSASAFGTGCHAVSSTSLHAQHEITPRRPAPLPCCLSSATGGSPLDWVTTEQGSEPLRLLVGCFRMGVVS